MSQKNRVSVVISKAKMDAVQAALNTIATNLDFLISLTDEERNEYVSLKDGNLPFVLKAYEHVMANPTNIPPFLDSVEFGKDVNAHQDLLKIWWPMSTIMSKLADTLLVTGGEAYVAGLIYYHFIKHAAKIGVPGAKAIYEDLKQRFKTQGTKKKNKGTNQ